ncbi:MAG TPA: GNAT family N-acetyltransferase [Anaerolineae bacterium]|nr:GNAT family N-acetyltransferase [Anaerolineae bacterium]
MVNFTSHSQDSIDVAELAAFTHRAYQLLPIPYRHGETPAELENFLQQRCPDVIVLARAADALLGWAGLYLGNWQANLLSWHPLVIPPNPAISQQLVRQCIQHTAASGRERMEVLLLNLTPEYQDYAAQCGAIYQAAGMARGVEWQSMEAGLQPFDFALRDIPETLMPHPLTEMSKDALWPCFDAAFATQQSTAQRRENFEAFFCQLTSLDADASLAVVDGETIVGFVAIGVTAEEAYVSGIGVIPTYRRRGLARYMLGTSMRRAATNQCRKMILQVDRENQAALGLYRNLGFQNVNHGWVSYFWEK